MSIPTSIVVVTASMSITHPAAAIGKVFHKLLEMAVRGQIARAGSPTEDVLATLEKLLDDEQALLVSNRQVLRREDAISRKDSQPSTPSVSAVAARNGLTN